VERGARRGARSVRSRAVTGSEKTLATVWQTSVARLTPESRRLLDRLAMLAPDPIPDSLLDVAIPGEAAGLLHSVARILRRLAGDRRIAGYDSQKARAGLYAYSLITRATGEDGAAKGFVVHSLVQDFARRAMREGRRTEALREALEWVNAAFVGAPNDVRSWPIHDPLAPHALAVARKADAAQIAEPTRRLFNQLAILSFAKARFAEAEPLYRRVVEITELVRGKDDPIVATCLNNVAQLLKKTNRLAKAEPLMRRALAIDEQNYGPHHPAVRETSTISRCCFGTRTASPRPSR
jgi:tetratricopeptide (TPR) repeat protein